MQRFSFASTFLLLVAFAAQAQSQEFFFKKNDRVVMIGDSITEQHLYSNYVEMFVTTRFPEWGITFRNVGIGGDRSTGGNSRFKRDVAYFKPTAMTVDFGMNDGNYTGFNEGFFKTYMDGLAGMAEKAKELNIRAAWITPQPLDTGDQGPTANTVYNLTLEKFSEGVKSIAEKNGGVFVDQFHPYLAVLDKARAAGPNYSRITGGDAVHPGPPGQVLMAATILKGLNYPKFVSTVEIDAGSKHLEKSSSCQIMDLKIDGTTVRFKRLEEALPFFPQDALPILKWSPILTDLNDYGLKVSGLKAGKYEIDLDGKKVAEFTSEELAKGVNMAQAVLTIGPVAEQVNAVQRAIEEKNRYFHDRIFRGVILSQVPDWLTSKSNSAEIEEKRKAAIDSRLTKMPEFEAAIQKALKMKPYLVEVRPIGK